MKQSIHDFVVATQLFLFMFTPKIGEDEPILTIIFFQMGWFNHQPDSKSNSNSIPICQFLIPRCSMYAWYI